MKQPLVSVLMPVYNGGLYLKDAVESILSQSLSDFEFIIIDDGSTDDSYSWLKSQSDNRIHLVKHDSNLGLITTLNEGIDLCKGVYIARMDADDKCESTRLKKQVAFLEKNPDIVVLGASMMDLESGNKYPVNPLSPPEVKAALFFSCCIAHPSVMMRNEIIQKEKFYYDPSFTHCEDYDLWLRISDKYKIANLPDYLLGYRFHQLQVSNKYNAVQREKIHECLFRQFSTIGVDANSEEVKLHYAITDLEFENTTAFLESAEHWLLKLIDANEKSGFFEKKYFNRETGNWWYNIFSTLQRNGVEVGKIVTGSRLSKSSILAPGQYIRFKVKQAYLGKK